MSLIGGIKGEKRGRKKVEGKGKGLFQMLRAAINIKGPSCM